MSVLCLIANPQDPRFDPALAGVIHREIGGEINWLNHGIACEIVAPRASDPAAEQDFPAYCRQTGHELVSATHEGNVLVFVIRKRA